MIGSTDDDGVDLVTFRFDHFAVVRIAARLKLVLFGEHGFRFVEVIRIDIDNRDNVFTNYAVKIFSGTIRCADAGDIEFFQETSGRLRGTFRNKEGRRKQSNRPSGGSVKKRSAVL